MSTIGFDHGWLTPRECAERSPLSLHTIHRLVASGQLPHTRVGRKVLVRAEDLEMLLSRGVARVGA